ncbi:MAG TPA: ATP-dependent Clp protease adaptor ClpS [Tenuifilaceae bacterium]|jgi:ATP-dependent Clp protease adaptor protein ClpS|nr:ATP-dependent Clp protease adaptor ClpS [Tenuifilaceae bacterium]HPX05870.1 ATP-dependent Clp protease adaptor ClpS [Tenuifilaceae bacterium]HQB77812.1 ATP-dependent Clp protease adaptor ClpS [Tenuifilaceae bacterium]
MIDSSKNSPFGQEEEGLVTRESAFLILYNDEVNSYDFVIESLIDVCDHEPVQAEQCTFIAHHKGKCDVKKGTYSSLKPLRDALTQRGLNVVIK